MDIDLLTAKKLELCDMLRKGERLNKEINDKRMELAALQGNASQLNAEIEKLEAANGGLKIKKK